MRIAVITAPRCVSYLHDTIRSLVGMDWSVSGRDVAVFSDSIAEPSVPIDVSKVETTNQIMLDRIQDGKFFGTFNFIRAMRWVGEGSGYGIVCEDDIEMAEGWAIRAEALAREAERRTPRFCMTLHHFYQLGDFHNDATVAGDVLMRWKSPKGFYGGQCLVFPPAVARMFANVLEKKVEQPYPERGKWVMDMAVKNLCIFLDTTLYATHPCLIQHTGDVSSVIHDRKPIRNVFFRKKWKP